MYVSSLCKKDIGAASFLNWQDHVCFVFIASAGMASSLSPTDSLPWPCHGKPSKDHRVFLFEIPTTPFNKNHVRINAAMFLGTIGFL